MPRTTELKSEEAASSSPLRRSCRIVAVSSPHPLKGRRLSATSENNGADEKNENKPARARRAASISKEDSEPKIEPAKPRTRRSSAAAEPAVVEEEKREPVTRSRRLSGAEEPSQETLKPVRTRRSSITDDAAKTPASAKNTEGDSKSKTVTRRRSISKEPSDEAEETKPATRSRRKSVDKDVEVVEILEKKTTRQRRASTEKLEEPETRVAKLTPIKNKRRLSVTDNAVVLEPIEEIESERRSLSPLLVNDTKNNAASVKRKHEPSKADLDLSIINECSFNEGNSSHTEEAISTSEMSTGPLKENDQMESETKEGKEEIEENSPAPADSITPPKEAKNVGEKSTTPKKSPRFRTSTDAETTRDDIVTNAQNNTENTKMSPELQDDVKKETSSGAILDKSQTSEKTTPENISKPAMDIETTKSLDKPKQTSPGTTISPRKSPRILARKENGTDQSEKDIKTLNSTMENLKETKTSSSITEKIKSPTPDKETPKSLHENIDDPKDSDQEGSPQKELNVEDDSAFLSKASEPTESQIKETDTHVSSGSDDSFQFNLSNSRENEEDDILNVSKISNGSDKENIAVNVDDDSIKSKAPPSAEKRVLGDLPVLNEKLTDLKQTTTVARVSNVFRPKNLEFSFVEPMDVDKTSVDLESTSSEKLDRTKLLSGATDDSIDESFKLNLSMTPVESPITSKVFDSPEKVIVSPEKVIDSPEKVIDSPKKVCDSPKKVVDSPKKVIDSPKKVIDSPKKVIDSPKKVIDDPIKVIDVRNKVIDTPNRESENVIPKSNTVKPDELIMDVSEASCAKDVSNISLSEEPTVEMKEENTEQVILDTTNNLKKSTFLEEAVNKPDEQIALKIAEDQSGDEKTSMSPDYDFHLPSDESSSELENKFFEGPSTPSRDDSRDSNVLKENKDLVNADKDLKPSDKEICGKLPAEQPEESSISIKLIESEEINDEEKENSEIEETAKTPNQASSITENEENIVETSDSETVINREPVETSEKPSSVEKSLSEEEEKDIEQKHEKSTFMDDFKIGCREGEKESNPEGDISTINSNIVETKEIEDNPNIAMENISLNENHTKTDSEDVSNDNKLQTDDQDKKTIEEIEETSETNSGDLKTDKTSFTDVQREQSPESVRIPLGTKLIKTEENIESSQHSIITVVDSDGGSIVDADSEIVKIDSPTNKDYDYEEMERSFQDIVKDDDIKLERNSESPISQPSSKTKKSKKARKSKGKGLDANQSDINEKLFEQHTVGTDSPQKIKTGNLRLDEPESSTKDSMLDSASCRTPKKTKKNTKNDATADKTDETVADTEQKSLSNVDNASAKELVDQHEFDFKLPKKKKCNRIDTEEVENNLEETDINVETKSSEDTYTKTPKKTKKRSKVIALTDDSTKSVPTEGHTLNEVERIGNFANVNEKTKRTKMSENYTNVQEAEESITKKKKNKKSKLQKSEKTQEKNLLEGFSHPKLDEIIDKMVMETQRKNERAIEGEDIEGEDSSEYEYASEEEEREKNSYIDSMAEEGEEDTPSEGSNDIIDYGESINTTESELDTDEDYEADSFICDDEVPEISSGNDECDLGDEETKKRKIKSRIINVEGCDSDVIRIERKKKPVKPKKRTRIISISSSSEDEKDESVNEVAEVLEHDPPEESVDEEFSEKPRKRTSSITIIENINVNDIKDNVLSERIHHLVDSFCTTMPPTGDISMNLSLEYAGVDEEPSTKADKQKSPRRSLLQTSPKETESKDVKKRRSAGEKTVVPTKKTKLSTSLNNFEDLQDVQEESNKRLNKSSDDINIKKSKKRTKSARRVPDVQEESNKRLNKSSEDINIKKSKKRTKSARRVPDVEEDKEVSNKKRKYSEDEFRSKTFSLLNQLITDVKNRPKRSVKPSTSKVDPSIDDSWEVEFVTVVPSTSIVSEREIEKYKFDKLHPKDFRNQMLYGSNRVKRIETKTLLKKKGAYS